MTGLRTLPDKELAIVVRREAARYIIAADTLADRSSLDLAHPCYFLRCHAIELLLKATLLATGSSLAQAEAYSHDLVRAFEDAKKRGRCWPVLIRSGLSSVVIWSAAGFRRAKLCRFIDCYKTYRWDLRKSAA